MSCKKLKIKDKMAMDLQSNPWEILFSTSHIGEIKAWEVVKSNKSGTAGSSPMTSESKELLIGQEVRLDEGMTYNIKKITDKDTDNIYSAEVNP